MALLCMSLLPRQRKVVCCCETIFSIIAELTYNLTYQIIISPIPSIPDFVYSHFAHKNYLNCFKNSCFIHSICKACDNLRMRGRTSKSARNILNDVRTTTLGNVWTSFWHLLEPRLPYGFYKPFFTPFKNRKLVLFRLWEFWDPKSSFIDRICVQEQQLYVKIKVQKSTIAAVRLSALSPDASRKMSWVWNENYHLFYDTYFTLCYSK